MFFGCPVRGEKNGIKSIYSKRKSFSFTINMIIQCNRKSKREGTRGVEIPATPLDRGEDKPIE
jgi:hypothetical protein